MPKVYYTVVRIRPYSIAGGIKLYKKTLFIKLQSKILKVDLACFKCKLWTWSNPFVRLSLLSAVSKSYSDNITGARRYEVVVKESEEGVVV